MPKSNNENQDTELDNIIQEFNTQLALNDSLRKHAMSVESLERKIRSLDRQIAAIETSNFTEVEERIEDAQALILKITTLQETLQSHNNISDLLEAGGLLSLREKYFPQLVSLFHRADDICKSKTSAKQSSPLSEQKQAASVISKLTLFQQAYKVKSAYSAINLGLKYKKAEFPEYLHKSTEDIHADLAAKMHNEVRSMRRDIQRIKKSGRKPAQIEKDLQQIKIPSLNPIKKLSQRNLRAIKKALSVDLERLITTGKLPATARNSFGLLPDEIDLFGALLNLPYKLQHGTNHFSDIARTGRLDSLTEIQRHRPEYSSPFSTPGNLQELGNGGFIFFRCFVDGVNSDQTRYGNTRIITDLSLLREIGWVSLHDQLVPFSSHNRQQTLYEGKRLLFKATPADVHNKAHKHKSADGIRYTYRVAPITTYQAGTKDTQKAFGTTIATSEETIKFTEEIFYGPDILPGIALSLIHRLRKLNACGFRQKLLNDFSKASDMDKIMLLGKVVKDFYRIEGKYPLGLPFEYSATSQRAFFRPVAGSDPHRRKEDCHLMIENPEGDGRQNIDLSVNTENAKQAFFSEKLLETENQIAVLQKQVGRTNKEEDIKTLAIYRQRKRDLEEKLQVFAEKTEEYLQKIEEACPDQDITWVRKRSYEFLKLLAMHFVPFFDGDTITIDDFKTISLQKLALLAHETWVDLLEMDETLWPTLLLFSSEELEGMAGGNVTLAIDDRGYRLEELRALFNKDEEIYSYATCDDLYDLIIQLAPHIPEKLFRFIEDTGEDIDWEEITDSLDGMERMLFEMNLRDYFEGSQESENSSDDAFSYIS
ncbi:Uncharacterised protein (plasmid) [Legionella adelaidensis]|uniref:Uncharacterized protein n=1 Tax=Legionella adelaidensis TaxID=45056 RepID=A0A0W0R5C2_9GAMM|nr:hypothetical protein [Legionella adelaidensis]KTC66275.1 hypothetical protein Lade_0933 [Legionella adelaidensis]VEH84871.1 Uncharacterised protein [Legionella adelaidensis]